MQLKINPVFVVLIIMSMAACKNDNKPVSFDYGSIQNDVYKNNYFDFTLNIPSGWKIQNIEDTLSTAGSEINSANLLSVFKYDLKPQDEYNPSFVIVAENLKSFPGIIDGRDYLFQTRQLLKKSKLEYESIDEYSKKETLGNKEFYSMSVSLKHDEDTIKQTYYSTITKGYCLTAILSYVSDDQKNELKEAVNTLSFKQKK